METPAYLASYPAERLYRDARVFGEMLRQAHASAPRFGEFDPNVGPFIGAMWEARAEREDELLRREDLAQSCSSWRA